MAKMTLKKEKWTLSFDPRLKEAVQRAARSRGMYPVSYLEELVREKLNPYGHTDVKNSVRHVRELRKKSKDKTDEKFLEEILLWQK
jgi:stalled ribosome rescue protein Dom34